MITRRSAIAGLAGILFTSAPVQASGKPLVIVTSYAS